MFRHGTSLVFRNVLDVLLEFLALLQFFQLFLGLSTVLALGNLTGADQLFHFQGTHSLVILG